MKWALVVLMFAACSGKDDDSDTDSAVDTSQPDEGCDETSLWVDGPDQPRVSQSWVVLMRCDGDTLVGPMVIRFTPDELVSIDGNEVTFTDPGEGELRVQVGTYVEKMPVTVLP